MFPGMFSEIFLMEKRSTYDFFRIEKLMFLLDRKVSEKITKKFKDFDYFKRIWNRSNRDAP